MRGAEKLKNQLAGSWTMLTDLVPQQEQTQGGGQVGLGSPIILALMQQWAKGDNKKLQYLHAWTQHVLSGGHMMAQNAPGGFGKGVELRSLLPQECDAFLSLFVPLLQQRERLEPGAKIVVHKRVERCALRIRVDQPKL
jgi:hypothetical protein